MFWFRNGSLAESQPNNIFQLKHNRLIKGVRSISISPTTSTICGRARDKNTANAIVTNVLICNASEDFQRTQKQNLNNHLRRRQDCSVDDSANALRQKVILGSSGLHRRNSPNQSISSKNHNAIYEGGAVNNKNTANFMPARSEGHSWVIRIVP